LEYKQNDIKYRSFIQNVFLKLSIIGLILTATTLLISSEYDDMCEGKDYYWGPCGVLSRVREPSCLYRDFTIRWDKEWQKIRMGKGDYYFYAWTDSNGDIDEILVLNLHKLRQLKLLDHPDNFPIIWNYDNKTRFKPINLNLLTECIILHKKKNEPNEPN
jgi:hypothetical protein